MNAILILIPISLLLAGVAVAVFFWATRHGQFDDLDTPGILPLLDHDDETAPSPTSPEAVGSGEEP
jgi:cbb3-type cytochrome oxidase maturation protein